MFLFIFSPEVKSVGKDDVAQDSLGGIVLRSKKGDLLAISRDWLALNSCSQSRRLQLFVMQSIPQILNQINVAGVIHEIIHLIGVSL